MKKSIISLCLLALAAFSANAQLQKGALVLGISTGQSPNVLFLDSGIGGQSVFGFNTYTADGENVTVINLNPRISYGVTKRLAIGSELGVGFLKYSDEGGFTSVSFNPFVRGHFPIGKIPKLQFLAQVGAGIGIATYNEDIGVDYKFGNVGLATGLAFFLAPAVSFDTMLGFNSIRLKEKDSDFGDNSNLSQFGLNVGVSVYFNHQADQK